MKYRTILFLFLLTLLPILTVKGHSYIFSKSKEEMKDRIFIYVQSEQITIQYESHYQGQIAPHVRIMMDTNSDSIITQKEVNEFFNQYKRFLNDMFQGFPLYLDDQPLNIHLMTASAPTIQKDSLLAPLKVRLVSTIDHVDLEKGNHKLRIEPKLFFLSGSQLISMAKEKVEFTDKQEKAIGRFLQIHISAPKHILFTKTYPGYINRSTGNVRIYGVFYDKTVLRMKKSRYPELQVQFTI